MANSEDYHQIVKNNFFDIVEAIADSGASTVEKIASDLFSHDLITTADEQAVLSPGSLSPFQLVARFMIPVLNNTKQAEAYKKLLQVLRRHNELNTIAATLEEEANKGIISEDIMPNAT